MSGILVAGIVVGFLATFAILLVIVAVAIMDGQRTNRDDVRRMTAKLECLTGRLDEGPRRP